MITPAVTASAAILLVAFICAPVLLQAMLRRGGLTLAAGGRDPVDAEQDGPS